MVTWALKTSTILTVWVTIASSLYHVMSMHLFKIFIFMQFSISVIHPFGLVIKQGLFL